jgi:phosphoglycolate phosphatase-like HAD superfamily hydrolase
MLGRAPIVDFDGTLARLGVDWAGLRARLGLTSLDELWERVDASADGWTDDPTWRAVTAAEIDAARVAEPVAPLVTALASCDGFAVLTGNSEAAVAAFLEITPRLRSLCLAVAGRETLRGSKRDQPAFARGFQRCVDATAAARAGAVPVYVGDLPWELTSARQLGAVAIDVTALGGVV